MLFVELPLYIAVCEVRDHVDKPGSDDWQHVLAKVAYKLVLERLIDDPSWAGSMTPPTLDRVIEVWRQIRKSSDKKLWLTCQVAKIHGVRCFYANRGVGPCSDEVELDRIIPEARGGVYSLANCLIACSSHNGRRQDRTIEDYLQPVPADGPMLVEFRTEG